MEDAQQTFDGFGRNCAREGTPLSEWLVGKKAVANVLGISVSTVGRYLSRYPDFPAYRRGGTIFVSPRALVAWIEHREIENHPPCEGATPKETR